MKRKDLDKMLNLIDDELLEEAKPSKKPKATKKPKSYFIQLAVCVACFLLVLNVSILTPILIARNFDNNGNSTEQGTIINNSFSNIIFNSQGGQKTEVVLSSPVSLIPDKYNSLKSLLKNKFPGLNEDAVEDNIKEEIDSSDKDESLEDATEKYEETTDLQVGGVVEGDLLKRSSKYLYYLDGQTLRIYSIKGNNSKLVSLYNMSKIYNLISDSTKIRGEKEITDDELYEEVLDKEEYDKRDIKEMFLANDLKTVTIVSQGYFEFDDGRNHYIRELPYVSLISLNIEDVNDIYVNNISILYGRYESARVVDGEIIVFTKYTPKRESAIVPQYSDGLGFKLFDHDKIYYNEETRTNKYLLAYRMNESTLIMNDVGAYLDYGDIIYVSKDNIYLTHEYYQRGENEHKTVTEILRIDYSNGKFEKKGVLKVDGYLKDRFSLDEYDGVLRVVTTDNTRDVKTLDDFGTSANLYCALVDTMEIKASVIRFAPSGEIVRSVRFKDYNAYVCTSIQTTDPVFFFDLGNLDNIYYKDTGTIPGFSNTLVDFGKDLLGIGVDSDWNLKIEVYRETDTGVERVCHYLVNGTCSDEYKAYFIDRKNGLIGLGIYDYNSQWPNRYVLLKYTGDGFMAVIDKEMNGDMDLMRATLVDGWFYIISDSDFVVREIPYSIAKRY